MCLCYYNFFENLGVDWNAAEPGRRGDAIGDYGGREGPERRGSATGDGPGRKSANVYQRGKPTKQDVGHWGTAATGKGTDLLLGG